MAGQHPASSFPAGTGAAGAAGPPSTARREASSRCVCGKWAVKGLLLLFGSLVSPESTFFPISAIRRTLSGTDAVPARWHWESGLVLATTGRSPEQAVSLDTLPLFLG